MVLDVAIRSNELYPHQPGRAPHRVMGTPGAASLRYLISGEQRPLLSADDLTEGRLDRDYRLQFLPPDDAFYLFQGFLGERRRIPGRSGPPGASYNIAPALKPRAIQLTAFYWREGDAGDLDRLDAVLRRGLTSGRRKSGRRGTAPGPARGRGPARDRRRGRRCRARA